VTEPSTARPRAVVLVANPAAPYSRGLRIARALEAEGYAVEIAAIAVPGLPDRELDGSVEIRRYRPTGPFAVLASAYPGTRATPRAGSNGTGADGSSAAAATATPGVARRRPPPPPRDDSTIRRIARFPRLIAGRVKRRLVAFVRWSLWPHTVRGWWHTLDRELAPADVIHACGSLTIRPALSARDRARATGHRAIAVYDAIDDVFESNNVLDMPGVLRRWHARRERRWATSADVRTTVNDALAERLARRWSIAEPPIVIPNYPEVAGGGADHPDRIRRTLGLPPTKRIVLFQGRLGPNLGLDEAAEAILLVPDAALVLIGFGRWWDRSLARDREARWTGRHFTLPAVHPDELASWTASADASLVPLPPVSFNQRHSTPNKFWESIAAGTPVVVGPDLPVMGTLVTTFDLGVVAASGSPADLAAAIRSVVDRPAADRAAWRAAILATAAERFSWSAAAAAYRAAVRAGVARAT
jgi:glycosyltransferase involved in cell wall biosynthesis